jgi:hypothetical protein
LLLVAPWLRANVIRSTGLTVHRRAKLVERIVIPGKQLPVPVRVEIAEARSGFFLFHYDANGQCVSDTWHATLVEAKEQAKFEFGIEDAGWVEVTNSGSGSLM